MGVRYRPCCLRRGGALHATLRVAHERRGDGAPGGALSFQLSRAASPFTCANCASLSAHTRAPPGAPSRRLCGAGPRFARGSYRNEPRVSRLPAEAHSGLGRSPGAARGQLARLDAGATPDIAIATSADTGSAPLSRPPPCISDPTQSGATGFASLTRDRRVGL